ncbi:phenylalanine--tRNA ligase subunit beta, partial [bacterium (Candidatus Moisslbacteria) CG12_big_fil_rev_8_21_14_0_65_36_11]
MKLSYYWLKDLSGIKISPEKMAEILDLHLAETGVKKLSNLNLENIFVGEIIDLKPHPQADKLKIAILDLGKKYKKLNIVCGATNIALGQKVPVALPGAKLSTGLEIKKTIIRGTESEGML